MNTKVLRKEMQKRAASMGRLGMGGRAPTLGEQVRGYRAKKAKSGTSYKPPIAAD